MLNLTTLKSVAAYDLIKVKLRTDADGTSRFLPHALPHTLPPPPLFSFITQGRGGAGIPGMPLSVSPSPPPTVLTPPAPPAVKPPGV